MKIIKLLPLLCWAALAWFSPAAAADGKSGSLTVWAWDENFNIRALNRAKEYYATENPGVTVNVVSMAQADIVQRLNTAFSAPNYAGLPDIVLIEDIRSQGYLRSYPGELRDLSALVAGDKFVEYKTKMVSLDGKCYGLPFDAGVVGLFYRTDYLEQAGFSKGDMENITWERYIEIGKQVKEKTGKYMLTLDPSDAGPLRIMMQASGAWYVGEDGVTVRVADNPALRSAVNAYKTMLVEEIALPITGWEPFVQGFQRGDVASVPTGCWIAPSVAAVPEQSGKWAIAPVPRLGDIPGSVNASNLGGSSWYVIDKSPNADLAIDFLAKTFASNIDLINDLAVDINLVTTMKAAYGVPNYGKASEFFGGQQIFADFFSWSDKVPPVDPGVYTYQIESMVAEAMMAEIQGANLDEMLQNIQSQAESWATH